MTLKTSHTRSLSLLFVPATLLIGLLFGLPVLLFFARTAAEAGGAGPFLDTIWLMLGSGPVTRHFGVRQAI